jgi:formylglycine-generating enzyme required for sulfatase activity
MRISALASILLFAPTVSLFSPLRADEKGDAWDAARKVFERSCFPCHGAGQRAARDFFVLKPDELRGNLKSVEKRVLDPSGENRMPPSAYRKNFEEKYGVTREAFDRLALTDAEAKSLRKWFDLGAPIVEAKAETVEFVRDEELIGAILNDALKVPPPDRKFARYLSLANLLRAGDGPGNMALYRNGIRKLLASLTWRPQVPEVTVLPGTKETVLRFDLRHLERPVAYSREKISPWDATLWEELARINPYELPLFGEPAIRLQRELGTKHVLLRADWFAFHTTQPGPYARILGLPGVFIENPVSSIEWNLLGVDVPRNIVEGNAARAGTTTSGVSANHRIIERHPLPGGNYFWASYDFRSTEGEGNILDFPTGPTIPFVWKNTHDFRQAGGEFIFSLPDGLQGYFLANAQGDALETAPTDIVQNPRRRDAVVQNGISCLECHAQGMRPTREDMDKFQDQLRPFVDATAEDGDLLEFVHRLHPGTEEIHRLIEEDRRHFEAALGRLGLEEAVDSNGRKVEAEPIFHLVDRFQEKVELRNAAAELNLTPEELKQQFSSPFLKNNRTMRRLAARLEYTQVSREEFVAEFGKLRDLMGAPQARAVGSEIPQPGKNFTILVWEPDVTMEMIWIEPGVFTMGSPADEPGRDNDETQHQVRLTKGFWLGNTEVSQRQYELIAGQNPSANRAAGPDAPVENLVLKHALAFCEAMKDRLPGLPPGYKFSLPTEAQWEYACRAGTQGPIYGPSLDAIAWYRENSGDRPHAVEKDAKAPNAWGLVGMLGNVSEWCFDRFTPYPSDFVADPEAPGNGSDQIIRGGGYNSFADSCRAADRVVNSPLLSFTSVGFRVCLRPVRG